MPTGCKKPKSCIVNPAVEEDVKPEGEGFRGLKGINFTSLKIWSKLLDSSLKRRLGELCVSHQFDSGMTTFSHSWGI